MNTNLATFITGLVTDENDRFYFVQKDGQTYVIACDTIINAVGFRPNNELEDLLEDIYMKMYVW